MSREWDLNPRPAVYDTAALPTELSRLVFAYALLAQTNFSGNIVFLKQSSVNLKTPIGRGFSFTSFPLFQQLLLDNSGLQNHYSTKVFQPEFYHGNISQLILANHKGDHLHFQLHHQNF